MRVLRLLLLRLLLWLPSGGCEPPLAAPVEKPCVLPRGRAGQDYLFQGGLANTIGCINGERRPGCAA